MDSIDRCLIPELLVSHKVGREYSVVAVSGSGKPSTSPDGSNHVEFGLYVLGISRHPTDVVMGFDPGKEVPEPERLLCNAVEYVKERINSHGTSGTAMKAESIADIVNSQKTAEEISRSQGISTEKAGEVLRICNNQALTRNVLVVFYKKAG